MLRIAHDADMHVPSIAELYIAQDLAGTLMEHKVVSVDTLIEVQEVQPTMTLVFKEDGVITGVTGNLLLRPNAVEPLLAGQFDAVNVNLDYLCRDGDPVALGYAWGVAATTKPAGKAVVTVGGLWRRQLLPNLATFTRAVTPIGRHIALTRHGYQPLRHPDDELMIGLPSAEERALYEKAALAA
jgi:hypothetical protein